MTPGEIAPLVQQYIGERLQEWEDAWYTGPHPACDNMTPAVDDAGTLVHYQWQDHLALFMDGNVDDFSRALQDGRPQALAIIEPIAQDFLMRHQLNLDRTSRLYRLACRELLKAETVIAQEIKKRVKGTFEGVYTAHPIPTAPTVPSQGKPSKPISEVMRLYFEEHKRRPRTDIQIKSGFEKFIEITGGDRPIQSITREECRQYKEVLMRFPRAMTASQRKRPVLEVINELGAGPAYQPLSASSINKYLHGLAHLFAWAIDQGFYHGDNPVQRMTIRQRGEHAPKEHMAFMSDELRMIFSHEKFRAQATRHPERYWLTLILLYSGSRREEIAQLALVDIKQQDGVLYFNITEGEGQALKNQGSRRRVPIHSHLIELGLLHFITQMRQAHQTRLFPMLKRGQNGYGDAVGKWFGRHLTRVGITEDTKVMHSFRDTANTRLTALRAHPAYQLALIGHEGTTVNEQHYQDRNQYPITVLQEELEKLNFRKELEALRQA
jgi:integrase